MASKSYMPRQKKDQVAWAAQFIVAVSPSVASYGLTPALMASFTNTNAGLQEAWLTSENPATRTKLTVDQRNQQLDKMKSLAGKLVSIIQGTPTVTSDMLLAAGLTVRNTKPKPRPAPQVAPVVVVTKTNGRTVTVDLRQALAKRGRPAGVASASVFTAPAGTSTTDMTAWSFYGNTNQTTLDVVFPPSATGDAVQITAFWNNTRSESGPSASPVAVNLPASGQLPSSKPMKIAA